MDTKRAERTELPESVLDRLRAVMQEQGLGPCELSERAGLAEGHVGLILSRRVKSPAATTMAAIATALGVSLDSLLYDPPETTHVRVRSSPPPVVEAIAVQPAQSKAEG